MPRMDTGRGAEPGLFTAFWASCELVTWWKMEVRPLGEKVWPRPTTSWSVTDHIVESAAPGAVDRRDGLRGVLAVVNPR